MRTVVLPPSLGQVARERAPRLKNALSAILNDDVEVTIASSYSELETTVSGARADLAWAPPIICAYVAEHIQAAYGMTRRGRSTYFAAIITPKSITDVADLKRTRVAWVDALSTAGYALPRAFLSRSGRDPDTWFSSQVFAGSYRAALEQVATGDAEATAIFCVEPTEAAALDTLRTLYPEASSPSAHSTLHVVAFTHSAPSDALIATRKASSKVLSALVAANANARRALVQCFDAEAMSPVNPAEYRRALSTRTDS